MNTDVKKTVTFTEENFEREVLKSDLPVVVDFWAEWCGPCRAFSPILESVAEDYEGRAKLGKVNVDENQDLAGRYKIASIPTLLFFKNGQIVDHVVGSVPKEELARKLDELLS